MLETMLAFHCGPALAGIKPSNIISCSKTKLPGLEQEIASLNEILNPSGIYFEILCQCNDRVMLMVYRRKQLTAYLAKKDISAFLAALGYPVRSGLEQMLAHLKHRLARRGKFPHEIGAFLGYPMKDIYGFLYYRNEGCKLIGQWKVYGNEEGAKLLFARYDRCRRAILKCVTEGHTLAQLFCTA